MNEWVEKYYTYIEAEQRLAPLTVRNYRRDIDRFAAWCSGSDPTDPIQPFDPLRVKSLHLREWVMHRAGEGCPPPSATTINRELASLKGLFRYLRKQKAIAGDPFLRLPPMRTPKRLPTFVPESRMREVRAEHDTPSTEPLIAMRDALIIDLLYGCGLRLAELIGIDREDFDPDFRSLRIVGKGDKERIVPIIEPISQKIKAYIDRIEGQNICKNEKKALILSKKGERISRIAVYRIVKRELGLGGVQGKRSPHVLRHTFATHLLDHGADIREIQELLGHSSLRATQVYTHTGIAQLKSAYAKAHPREKQDKESET